MLARRFSIFFALWMATVLTGPAFAWGAKPATVGPLDEAHAHNDYLHARPLEDALDHGFMSVEADIFLVDGKLLVAHTKNELKPDRTLQKLYLDPLRKRVIASGGNVYPGHGPFTLLIDIKSSSAATYGVLSKELAEYADILSTVRNGRVEPKAIDVVISGDRPQAIMAAEAVRYAGIDGRLSDLNSDLPVHLLPLISDNWALFFKWKGQGPIGDADLTKLQDAVAKAHAHGRRIRFWATPDNENVWRELHANGVDLINTDDLAGLEKFLRGASAKN
jgi:hypothetical protein